MWQTADKIMYSSFGSARNFRDFRGWFGSRVVSVLDLDAEGPGLNRSRDAVGKQS